MATVDFALSARLSAARAAAPGLVVVALAATGAYAVSDVVPGINSSSAAVAIGAVLANAGLIRASYSPGLRFAAHRLLRVAVVILGLQLAVPELLHLGASGLIVVAVTVVATFVGTQLLGRALGVSPARSLLVATGFSICGASAVAAMKPVSDGKDDDAGIAIALVTLCGSLAIIVLPALRVPLGLDVASFGSWVGASVHDVGQTVATANRVPGALAGAVVVKLTRVLLLAPLVMAVAIRRRRRAQVAGGSASVRRPPPIPLFVAGFLVAVALRSVGVVPADVVTDAKHVQGVLLAAALVGLGAGIHIPTLVRTGGRALVLGLSSWVLVAGVAYAGVRLLGR